MEKAIEIDPEYATAYGHLGVTYYVRRNYEEAIPNLKKAIDLGARSEEHCYELGFSYAYLDQCDKAVPWFEGALEINPHSAVAQEGLQYCREKE